ATLFTAGGTTGVPPPSDYALAPFAALMSSGPDRPAPLSQFTPGRAEAGLVTGHRLPNLPGVDGVPINRAVLERMARGETAIAAAMAELERNPGADAGIIALDVNGVLFAGNTALVDGRPDTGRAILRDARRGAAVAVLHNAIHPHAPLARLAAAVALDAIAPTDRVDFLVRLDAGTPVELGPENCVFVDADNVALRIAVTEPAWLSGQRGGAVVSFAALVRRGDQILGYATAEPYGIVEAGRVVSLSGAESVELGVRAAESISPGAGSAADAS
ncbi:MAG: DUF6963 family protein, partial [Geminicoccaceae bacterium]